MTRIAWWFAAGWAALLPVLALAVTVGTEVSSGSDGVETTRSVTLVESEGIGGLIVVSVPLVLVLLVGAALASRGPWGLRIAWVVWGLLALGNLAAIMSVGFAVLPVTAALAVALISHTRRARAARRAYAGVA